MNGIAFIRNFPSLDKKLISILELLPIIVMTTETMWMRMREDRSGNMNENENGNRKGNINGNRTDGAGDADSNWKEKMYTKKCIEQTMVLVITLWRWSNGDIPDQILKMNCKGSIIYRTFFHFTTVPLCIWYAINNLRLPVSSESFKPFLEWYFSEIMVFKISSFTRNSPLRYLLLLEFPMFLKTSFLSEGTGRVKAFTDLKKDLIFSLISFLRWTLSVNPLSFFKICKKEDKSFTVVFYFDFFQRSYCNSYSLKQKTFKFNQLK